MTREYAGSSNSDNERLHVGRREYIKLGGAAVTGAGVGISATGIAAAELSRSSYTIRTGTDEETTVYVTEAAADGPTLMVVGGMHGDEKSGFRSARRIKNWDIDAGRLVVLPEANKYGIARDSRQCASGDLNRDFPAGDAPESKLADAIWQVAVDEDIDFLWDLHSSYGVYKSGDGGVGQALFATSAGNAGVHTKSIRDYLNAEVVSGSLDKKFDFREYTHHNDGANDMLKHKVGADLDAPAVIMETTEKLPLDRQMKYHLAAMKRFFYRFGLLETRSGTSDGDGNLTYDGDATSLDVDGSGRDSSVQFRLTNDSDGDVRLTAISLDPHNGNIDGLSDHSYDEGQWKSELHVAADVQDGLTDVNGGMSLPGTIALGSDGHSDSADREAILSGGSSATVSLYQFEAGDDPVYMDREPVDVTVEYELDGGKTGSSSFTITP